ncbi:CHAT domain-containing protein [Russula compacta]|nr:CHAT domain-containing protein [Russula compacta]
MEAPLRESSIRSWSWNPNPWLPQLDLNIPLLTASLLEIDDRISRFQAMLLTSPRSDPLRSTYLSNMASARLARFLISDENGDLDKSIAYSTEAILLPSSRPPIKRGSNLVYSLVYRFNQTHSLDDYREAMSIMDKILANPNRDAELVELATAMAGSLAFSRFQYYGKPEHIEEAILRIRTLLGSMSPENPQRRTYARCLERLEKARLDEFNIAINQQEAGGAGNDEAVPDRFWASYQWTWAARGHGHPSTPIAYENALSLMQDSLAFAPTLGVQHFRLVTMRSEYEKLPLDYASYQIHIGQLEQAIETLERGRGLLWSEMRGFRTLIGQLGVVNLPLAEKFAAVNRELEELTMTSSEGVWMDGGQVDNGGEGMDAFGRLVVKQQKLVQERDKLISQIQSLPGFETFSKAHSFDTLRSAAAHGPVIIINHSEWRSDIIILYRDSAPSLIPTSDGFYGRAKGLRDELLAARDKGLDSADYEEALSRVLENLYDLVGRPVIQRLHELKVPEQSRLWWCPTSVFCSLPLHAMGPIRSDGRNKSYFSDLYIPSYTPTLSALIESRNTGVRSLGKPSMLLVAHPDARMPSALQEMQIVQAICPSVDTLLWKTATRVATLQHMREHRFAHISCHGILETGRPFDAYLKLHKGARLTLLDVVRSQLPTAEFAFLSACHTAEITEESIADEGLHLAAAVQYSGFRSVVGTMWEMADDDGPDLAENFYRSVFSVSDRWRGVPYYERTAEALRDAVVNLRTCRRKRDMTLERWVNFVHYGA